ncbi:MAG: hypothetical protein RIT81_09275 [Deltaproteobacteria bacterium]
MSARLEERPRFRQDERQETNCGGEPVVQAATRTNDLLDHPGGRQGSTNSGRRANVGNVFASSIIRRSVGLKLRVRFISALLSVGLEPIVVAFTGTTASQRAMSARLLASMLAAIATTSAAGQGNRCLDAQHEGRLQLRRRRP